MRMQAEHKFPPNGRSGLFLVFGIFEIFESLPAGTPDRGFPQTEHFAGECFFFP
jgi:hypothetical protein